MSLVSVFKLVFEASIMGSILAIIIFVLKAVFKNKLSQNWQYYICFLVILRLMFPIAPSSQFSIFNVFKTPIHEITNACNYKEIQPEKNISGTFENNQTDSKVSDITLDKQENFKKNSEKISAKNILDLITWENMSVIWMIIMLVIFLYILFSYIVFPVRICKEPLCRNKKIY